MSDQLYTLILMANQIAANNSHCGSEAEAAERVRTHLKRFWARSMKQQIVDYLHRDGSQLSSIAKVAITELNTPSSAQ
ncbi:formate dehydrogenase subunit delta [Pseudomonas asiatica]|uniref:Formate dehydrogenase n=1 Tax=Pseudomonas monteilii TaxID=76759 RepID=A0A2N1IN16_9PSED|nr:MULTISPECIES: formate dehydrogenase subunit delta [Pseudomonas]PKI19636.1 formate dehydrogenase [Pseudomonas monteilii]RPD93846.1 formate dehydrogenase [Pseudomonas monteilii]WDM87356.1 formate dehydrogenase subunit delta [Pseudomonas asiatica]